MNTISEGLDAIQDTVVKMINHGHKFMASFHPFFGLGPPESGSKPDKHNPNDIISGICRHLTNMFNDISKHWQSIVDVQVTHWSKGVGQETEDGSKSKKIKREDKLKKITESTLKLKMAGSEMEALANKIPTITRKAVIDESYLKPFEFDSSFASNTFFREHAINVQKIIDEVTRELRSVDVHVPESEHKPEFGWSGFDMREVSLDIEKGTNLFVCEIEFNF